MLPVPLRRQRHKPAVAQFLVVSCMRFAILFAALVAVVTGVFAADTTVTNESEAAQQERLFQRFLKEMRGEEQSKAPTNFDVSFMTNLDTPSFREMFKRMFVVHPSFGLRWDEVPPPTITDSNAMKGVDEFITTNGWNMYTNGYVFALNINKPKTIRDLPWQAIHDREFPALTDQGILYVEFGGFGGGCNGVAYNPKTNSFAWGIRGFKPVGQHWYVWLAPEDMGKRIQQYEGDKP